MTIAIAPATGFGEGPEGSVAGRRILHKCSP